MFDKDQIENHPLLPTDEIMHIIEFEQGASIGEAIGVCVWNALKYKYHKSKMDAFERWRELLRDLLEAGYGYDTNLRYAMKVEYPNMKYTLGE